MNYSLVCCEILALVNLSVSLMKLQDYYAPFRENEDARALKDALESVKERLKVLGTLGNLKLYSDLTHRPNLNIAILSCIFLKIILKIFMYNCSTCSTLISQSDLWHLSIINSLLIIKLWFLRLYYLRVWQLVAFLYPKCVMCLSWTQLYPRRGNWSSTWNWYVQLLFHT